MTKTRWAELSEKQQWDVQVALRGPDCQYSESIKWVTTSVIRWALHTIMRVGGILNEDLKLIIIPSDCWSLNKEVKHATRVMCWSPQHFFQHVAEAAKVCEIPVVSVPNVIYIQAVSLDINWAMVKLWEWADAHTTHAFLAKELARHCSTRFGWDVNEAVKQLAPNFVSPEEDK